MTWGMDVSPPPARLSAGDWPLIVLRGSMLAMLLVAGLAILLLLRLPERAVFGLRRPLTPWLVQGVCRLALRIIGLRVQVQGRAMDTRGALVANHASWLDIFVLNAHARVFFVSKHEVANWPGIGLLARATGTVFIQRERSQAAVQTLLFQARLRAGQRLLFFPEGTSSDGQRVLPFKPALFQAFLAPDLAPILHLQPVSVTYHAPKGHDPRHYAWWGKMDFGPHLLHVLATRRKGRIALVFHPPIHAMADGGRKALAAACEASVRAGFGIN